MVRGPAEATFGMAVVVGFFGMGIIMAVVWMADAARAVAQARSCQDRFNDVAAPLRMGGNAERGLDGKGTVKPNLRFQRSTTKTVYSGGHSRMRCDIQ